MPYKLPKIKFETILDIFREFFGLIVNRLQKLKYNGLQIAEIINYFLFTTITRSVGKTSHEHLIGRALQQKS